MPDTCPMPPQAIKILRVAGNTVAIVQLIVLMLLTESPLVAHAQLKIASAGDSYASGEGAPDIGPGGLWRGDNRDGRAKACHRSNRAGASLAALLVRANAFLSVACSGATTGSVLLQLDLVRKFSSETDALILSVGGNDIGFAGMVFFCVVIPECGLDENLGSALRGRLADLPTRLNTVFDAVNNGRAGDSVYNVLVVEYPDPTTGILGIHCGIPFTNPGFYGFESWEFGESIWASREVVQPLNAALAAAVRRANHMAAGKRRWHFVQGLSGLNGSYFTRGFCTGFPSPNWFAWFHGRWINTLVDSYVNQVDYRGAMHPNEYGQQAIAVALVGVLSTIRPGPPPPPPPPPPPLRQMLVSFQDTPPSLKSGATGTGTITVSAVDAQTGAALTGRVELTAPNKTKYTGVTGVPISYKCLANVGGGLVPLICSGEVTVSGFKPGPFNTTLPTP